MTALYFELPACPRPRVGQAACVAGAARDRVPARDARRALPDDAARVRRACRATRAGSRIRSRLTSRPDRSGSARRRPIWSALAHRYVAGHFEVPQGGRQVVAGRRRRARRGRVLGGDRRSDRLAPGRGAVDRRPQPPVARPGRARHRRGPPRGDVRGGGLARRSRSSTAAGCGELFDAPRWRGAAPADRRDDQRGVPAAAARVGRRAPRAPARRQARDRRATGSELVAELDDERAAGRDPRPRRPRPRPMLLDAFAQADAVVDRPSVIFAYTIKAWRLATEGHPGQPLGAAVGRRSGSSWRPTWAPTPTIHGRRFADGLAGGRALPRRRPIGCAREHVTADATAGGPARRSAATTPARASTQQAFGRFFVDLAHAAPEVAAHVVTVSPDVASSTNLGGWINHVGIWHLGERIDWFADDTDTLVRWRESEHGQHIELGIAEGNLVGLLGELGADLVSRRRSRCCRSARCMTRSSTARSSRGRSASTPARSRSWSGRRRGSRSRPRAARTSRSSRRRSGSSSRAASPGSRPSARTSSGRCCTALGRLGRTDGCSAYFRLTTRPIDQALRRARRRDERERADARCSPAAICCGAPTGAPAVTLVGMGAVMPEVVAAADELDDAGIPVDVVCLTSADLVFRALQRPPGARPRR